ncbi:MAG: DUF192 domain-containing protein [Halorientalis sp.]
MRLVHATAGDERPLARRVEVADSWLARGRGLMFRRSIPDDYALAFPFGRASTRRLHMVCVPFDIDAVWTVDDEVRAVERLAAWTGLGSATADVVYELPAGAADGVDVGDTVALRDGSA